MWLFALFLAIPLIEIGLFIQLGGLIGLWPTLLIVILTAFIGTWLVRTQGIQAMSQLRGSFEKLDDPSKPLADGAMILIAGVLLLTPGFFTDAVGFLLLFPPFRSAVYAYAKSRVQVQSFTMGQPQRPSQPYSGQDVIDGEYHDVSESRPRTSGDSGWTKH